MLLFFPFLSSPLLSRFQLFICGGLISPQSCRPTDRLAATWQTPNARGMWVFPNWCSQLLRNWVKASDPLATVVCSGKICTSSDVFIMWLREVACCCWGKFLPRWVALIISRLTWLPVVWMEHTTFWMFYQMLIGLKNSNILLFTEAFANVNRGLRKNKTKKNNEKWRCWFVLGLLELQIISKKHILIANLSVCNSIYPLMEMN